MNKTLLPLAALLSIGLAVLACSSDETNAAGPANAPPTTTATPPSSTTDGGGTTPTGDAAATCTGPTFDNTRIPGWPNVPSP